MNGIGIILIKAGFDIRISCFFSTYLINRQTQYVWNYFTSTSFKADVRIEQGSTLSPILSALYITSLFYIFKKRTKNLSISIPVSLLYFVDSGLFISQEKSYEKSNTILYYSYTIISFFFSQFGLIIKHNKSQVFYFSRSTKKINPSPLDLRSVGSSILKSKDIWCYLGFFFNKKLSFQYHIYYYANKSLSTIKEMKMLGNSTRYLFLVHKQLLYRTCILSIVLYGLQLWYFKEVLIYYPLKELKKMQRKAVL